MIQPNNMTKIEAAISRVWTEVLGDQNIDRESNFFDLGGTSLQVLSMIMTIWRDIEFQFPASLFFDSINLAEFATNVEIAMDRMAGLTGTD